MKTTPNVDNKKRIRQVPQSQNLNDNWTESYPPTVNSESNTAVTTVNKVATGNIIASEEEKT